MLTKAPRGTKDLVGEDIKYFRYIESVMREVAACYGFSEIRTPIFEHTELFLRGVGDTTDIVQKEMYTFESKGKDSITLRPEGTAGAARAFIEQKLYANSQPTKLFYFGPMFRYERPQAGRQRQFHQFGLELFGASDAAADAEVIALAMQALKKIGIQDLKVSLNTIGGAESRAVFNQKIKGYLGERLGELCETCNERFEKNPLRILDCKNPSCKEIVQGAPTVLEALTEEDRKHFEEVQAYLTAMNIPFEVDTSIVRGLDYYTKTVFEIISNDIGAQSTVCGGGRYDRLIEEVGGPATPAVGFAIGVERLVLMMQVKKIQPPQQKGTQLFVGHIGENAKKAAVQLVYQCRQQGISAESDLLGRSVKAQMKYADKIQAQYTVILGDNEIQNQQAKLKNMSTGEQKEVSLSDIINEVK